MCHISGRFYLLGWLQPLGFSQPSLNLSCSFAITRVSTLLSIWMTSWSWFAQSGKVRGLARLVHLGLHIIFSKPDLNLTQTSCFLGLCWDTVHMLVYLPPGNLADIQQLALSLLQPNLLKFVRSCPFYARPIFVPMATPNCGDCVVSFTVTY